MRYGIDDKPPLKDFLLYALQWWVVTLPCVVIMGAVTAMLHAPDTAFHILYMQKLFAVMGAATIIQVLVGHRLPLIIGPASTLLVGIIASVSSGMDALYSSIFLGGAILSAAGFAGLFAKLRFFFTPRIVAVVLVLIAFTLSPTILKLVAPGDAGAFPLCFAVALVVSLAYCNYKLTGAAKSLTVLFGMVGGTLVYWLGKGFPSLHAIPVTESFFPLHIELAFHPGTLLAFVFCFLALAVNELGSIEAVGHMLQADGMNGRVRRGIGVTGIANMASGWLGVIGPVDFSMSSGIIAATGCASRFTLIPAGAGLIACAFFPDFILVLSAIPAPVMGALLLYLMASQLASGLAMLVTGKSVSDFTSSITVALPLMIGLIVAFAPGAVFNAFPDLLRPIVGNGFVMGTLAVILLEHGIFRK